MDSTRHLPLPILFTPLPNKLSEMHIHPGSFTSNPHSNNFSSPGSHSIDTPPIVSEPSWEWAPTSEMMRRESFDSVTTDNRCLSRDTFTPEGFVNGGYLPVSSMNEDAYTSYHEFHVSYTVDGNRGFNDQPMGFELCSNNAFTGRQYDSVAKGTPPLDHDSYSQTPPMGCSPVSADFVVPSQTVLEAFDVHSPLRHAKSFNSEMSYHSPGAEYATIGEYFGESPSGRDGFRLSYYDLNPTCPRTSRPSPLQYPMVLPLRSSPAYQKLPNLVPSQASFKSEKGKVERASPQLRKRIKREVTNAALPCNISVQKRSRKPCTWGGCTKKFERQEHLKRHTKTHTQTESHPCPFCKKPFSRTDNLKTHISLHADPNKKSMRTTYCPEAERVWQEMNSKPRRGAEAQKTSRSRI